MKISINKKLAKLSPKEFETWWDNLNLDKTGLDWKKEYKKIGGKIELVKSVKKSTSN